MNLKTLNEENYIILNGKIENAILRHEENRLILRLVISGDGWGCNYGDYDLNDTKFDGTRSLIDLMSTLHVEEFNELTEQYVRVAVQNTDAPVIIFGNIIYDEWFNYTDYIIVPESESEPVEQVSDLEVVEEKIEDDVDE